MSHGSDLAADPAIDPSSVPATTASPGSTDRDTSLARCFTDDYQRLVGLACLLVDGRSEAEEVVQEAFVRVYASWRNVRRPDDPLPYVRQAVVNVARGGLRRRMTERRHHERAQQAPIDDTDPRDDPNAIVESRWRDQELLGAVRRLPRRQREVVALRYFDERSTAETSAILGCSDGAVKAYLHRALTSLREHVREEAEER
jgi:RNA polymerase sigma-70 factor (sigma-E family)